MDQWYTKLCDFLFSKEVGIELFKTLLTALIGFITFKIYQLYRNKKDNSKLYIQMIKLEREFQENINILEDIINSHSRYQLLDEIFKSNNSKGIYELFDLTLSINNYVYENIVYEYGEPIDVEYVYTEYPYEIIKNLNYEKNEIELEGEDYFGQLDNINESIKKYYRSSIFDIFIEIEKLIKNISVDGNHEMSSSINYLYEEVTSYNLKSKAAKEEKLDDFCSQLIDGNNIFSKSLEVFKEYKHLERKRNKEKTYKKNMIKIEFKTWQDQDMDLLIAYNSDDYIFLEDFYRKNNTIELDYYELDSVMKLKKEFQTINCDRVKKIKNRLKDTLKKTNKYFSKI